MGVFAVEPNGFCIMRPDEPIRSEAEYHNLDTRYPPQARVPEHWPQVLLLWKLWMMGPQWRIMGH